MPFNAVVTANQARTGALMAMGSMLCVQIGLAVDEELQPLPDRLVVFDQQYAQTFIHPSPDQSQCVAQTSGRQFLPCERQR